MKQPSKARPWLTPLAPLYRLGLALEELQLRTGLKPVRRLRWPVVSIGNLSTGGAGKTPLTIALAQALVRRGLRVDVLSRGYGRRSALPLPVEPRGTAEEFGDEPLLIAREAGVPVYVADERYQAGLLAENSEQLPGGLHLLDDGFQHRQLHRDVDILLLNRQDWKDSLLPAGNLREPIRAAYRAGVIAIPAEDGELETELKTSGWQGSIWRVRRRMEVPAVDGPVAAFCGIARPEQFFDGLESGGLRIAARIPFPDHHRYTARDMDRLVSAARTAGAAAFVTTEKDRVRLGELTAGFSELIPLKTAGLRIEIEDEGPTVDSLADQVRLMQRPHRGS